MTCPKCRRESPTDAVVCHSCGAHLTAPEAPPPAVTSPLGGSDELLLTVPEVVQALAAVDRELLAELDRYRLMRLIAYRAAGLVGA